MPGTLTTIAGKIREKVLAALRLNTTENFVSLIRSVLQGLLEGLNLSCKVSHCA